MFVPSTMDTEKVRMKDEIKNKLKTFFSHMSSKSVLLNEKLHLFTVVLYSKEIVYKRLLLFKVQSKKNGRNVKITEKEFERKERVRRGRRKVTK